MEGRKRSLGHKPASFAFILGGAQVPASVKRGAKQGSRERQAAYGTLKKQKREEEKKRGGQMETEKAAEAQSQLFAEAWGTL